MLVPVIDAAGSDYEIGFQHGSALPAMHDTLRATIDRHASQTDVHLYHEADRRLDALSELLARHSPATLAQINGLAAAFDLTPDPLLRWLMGGYLYADLGANLPNYPADGCTVWAASGSNGDQGPLLVKNRDQPPDSLPLQFVLRASPSGRLPWTAVTTMGAPGIHSSGINAAGLAIADTHVPSLDIGPGLPRFSLMLHVLEEHEAITSALAYLMSAPMMGGGNLVLADAAGAVAVVECGHRSRAVSSRQSGPILATNHFISAALEDAYALGPDSDGFASSRGRYAIVRRELARCPEDITPAFARSLMSYHGDWAETICKHGSETPPSQTISCVIFHPWARTLEICHGHPCTASYRTIAVTPSSE